MGMFTKPILDLIARRPGIRMIEIADAVDCDVDMVEKSIMAEITAGVIIVEEVKKSNGHPTNSYRHAKPVPLLEPESGVHIPDAPEPASAPPKELPAFLDKKEKTKVQLGIDCIVANGGRATIAQVHEAMGLRKDQSATPFMNGPLIKGIVAREGGAREGRDWILGPNYPGGANVAEIRPVSPEPAPPAAIEETATTEEPATEEDVKAEQPLDEFGCALWSDGEFIIARDGEVIAHLKADEFKHMRRYISRIRDEEVTA